MDSSRAMDLVCENLDVITLTCPESQDPIFHDLHESPMAVEDDERDELLGLGSPAPSVELEEREVLTLLDSLTSSPPSTPAHSNNKSSLEFLHNIRSLIGDLVYMHFGNS